MNPLLRHYKDPISYDQLDLDHVSQSVSLVIELVKKEIDKVLSSSSNDKENRLWRRDHLIDILDNVLSPLYLLKETHPDEPMRDACQAAVESLLNFHNELCLNEDLYNALKEFADTNPELNDIEKRYLKKSLDDYHRNGFQLSKEEREKLKALDDQINQLELSFRRNISEWNEFVILSEAEIDGLPQDFKDSHKEPDGNYKVMIKRPDYTDLMNYVNSATVRKNIYDRYQNRAVENIPVLDKIIKLRTKRSHLLGYKTYAAYKLESKMAGSTQAVWDFIRELSDKLQEKAKLDYDILCEAEGLSRFDIWDKSWLTTRYKENQYQLSDEEVRSYFPFQRVTDGLFELAQTLYQVRFIHNPRIPVWNNDVKAYEVWESDQLIARFYLDMFPRPNKYSHAACFGLQSGCLQLDGSYKLPEAALVCNFPSPSEKRPSLLTHKNVETYFHEFGHLLHQLLTKAPFAEFSGTSVERDFVEMPSQIMENWVWEKEALQRFAKHYKTDEIIPDHLIEKLLAAKHLNSGIDNQMQLFFTALDMTYHDGFEPKTPEDTTRKMKELQGKLTLFPALENSRFQASFDHLIGYAAGYYGYLWSCVYADDMYSVFKNGGIFEPKIGRRFRKTILEKGNTEDPMILIKTFLGREPKMDAFLANLGIVEN